MFVNQIQSSRLSRSSLRPGPFATLLTWAEVHRQRQALARLDAQGLADIGVSATEARIEAARPFWDID